MSGAKRELILGCSMIVLAAITFFMIIPAGVDRPSDIEVAALAPSFWPQIIVAAVALMGAILALQSYRSLRSGKAPTSDNSAEDEEDYEIDLPSGQLIRRVVTFVVGLFVFFFLLEIGGLVVTSMVALVATILFTGERRPVIILSISILLPIILFAFFVFVANVPIPMGMFEGLI